MPVSKKTKLELTWIGKEHRLKLVSRRIAEKMTIERLAQ